MTKTEFVSYLANQCDLTKKDAAEAINNVFDTIITALSDGEEVNISGFGKFSTATTNPRTARNPRTGESVEVEAHTKLKFSYSTALKASFR